MEWLKITGRVMARSEALLEIITNTIREPMTSRRPSDCVQVEIYGTGYEAIVQGLHLVHLPVTVLLHLDYHGDSGYVAITPGREAWRLAARLVIASAGVRTSQIWSELGY